MVRVDIWVTEEVIDSITGHLQSQGEPYWIMDARTRQMHGARTEYGIMLKHPARSPELLRAAAMLALRFPGVKVDTGRERMYNHDSINYGGNHELYSYS